MTIATEPTAHLGPARVLTAGGKLVKICVTGREVWARLALAFPYQVQTEDVVLVAGNGEAWYVIGILEGRGPTTFLAPGDVSIRAPHGKIEMVAAEGIRIQSSQVSLIAGRLELAAKIVRERFAQAWCWVKGTVRMRAGRMRTNVRGEYDLHAEQIDERAREGVRIDGTKINLG